MRCATCRVACQAKIIADDSAACSERSDHEPSVGPSSARLTLTLCTLVEHVAQSIVVAVFVHVVDAHMSATS